MGKFGEPWRCFWQNGRVSVKDDTIIGYFQHKTHRKGTMGDYDSIVYDEHGQRACACVNACAGMDAPEKEIADKDAEIARLKSNLSQWEEWHDSLRSNESVNGLVHQSDYGLYSFLMDGPIFAEATNAKSTD
jgi:ATP-dependent DNA ligase